MKKKTDFKVYQNKNRIYVTIPNANRISRLYVWDENKKEYCPPEYGKAYMACRYENAKRIKKFFEKLDEARNWQQGIENPINPFDPIKKVNTTPLFSAVVTDWKKRSLQGAEKSTMRLYERTLGHHFFMMMDKHMDEITGNYIDSWLDEIMDGAGFRALDPNRISFGGEINLLRTILLYYKDSARKNYNHTTWVYPLEKNQLKRAKTKIRKSKRDRGKKLSAPEFFIFREALKGKYQAIMQDFSTVQFFCSLRVSECAALHHEDIHLDFANPSLSKVTVKWHVDWPRETGVKSEILPGFKNSKSLDNQVKVLAIFPEAFKVLKEIWKPGSKELVFKNGDSFFEYREIENAYNNAFEQAQLPYTGTHVMRHGGTSWLFDESGGDASLCQLQLGVAEMDTVFTYVKRNKDALNNFSQKMWEKENNE